MGVINNVNQRLGDDLKQSISHKSKLSIAAACFSIYAFEILKKELSKVDEVRFLFTSPTFVADTFKKEQREFYIPKRNREKGLYGTEYEIRLKNELTLKAIAKECADWIRRKVQFKSNTTMDHIPSMINLETDDKKITYYPINGFTTVDLGYEKGNMPFNLVYKVTDSNDTKQFFQTFEHIWNDKERLEIVTEQVLDHITTVYKENPPDFLYHVILYNIFHEFLHDVSEDTLPNEATGFKQTAIWNRLYRFQKDAVIGIINRLEKYNGCILADSVGLGKTFTALAVIKYYELRNKSVLVLCPKKLGDNWKTFKLNVTNNILYADRFRYDVLYHTDISRESGESNGIPLDRINWGNYDLLVIDESHNFRNNDPKKVGENRYQKLMRKVIKSGVKTKVLMLSATPVNNRFNDLRNQLALAYEGNPDEINQKLGTKRGINEIFRRAQAAFNRWSKLPEQERTTERLLEMLDFDFFELLDSLTIARSRKHIQTYYDATEIGTFPKRLPPISKFCDLTDRNDVIGLPEIYKALSRLKLALYAPFNYILKSRLPFYEKQYDTVVSIGGGSLKQKDREVQLQGLMRINLLKRLESSVESFRLTLQNILTRMNDTLSRIEAYENSAKRDVVVYTELDNMDLDEDDWLDEEFSIGDTVKINLSDMDLISWKEDLLHDVHILQMLLKEMKKITPEHDLKLKTLMQIIDEKIQHPINPGNRKILIFSAFSDTVEYLYNHLSPYVKEKYDIHTAKIVGNDVNKNTAGLKNDMLTLLTCFSPCSKERDLTMPEMTTDIDLLIATDCISEGQNLQDCDFVVNYDIHWNPVRVIQRFGRVDRIGSKNEQIQMVNFWPNITLDEYIRLKERVENRMVIMDMTATGEDNVLTNQSSDLEYRKKQLERLQREVVDLEDMNTGVTITDLGLNDFRMDLLGYVKSHGDLDKIPNGLHAVVAADETKGLPPGVIFVLRNLHSDLNQHQQNRFHPFYIVYMGDDGQVVWNHLEFKKSLDALRALCKGKTEPLMELCRHFNQETDDGRNMQKYSALLQESIRSIVQVKEQTDLESLFSAGGTTALTGSFKGMDDFELIAFVVVR